MYTDAGFTSVTGVTPVSRGCHTSVTILYNILYIIYTLTVYSVRVNKSKQVSQTLQNNRLKKFLVFWYSPSFCRDVFVTLPLPLSKRGVTGA